MLGCALVPIVGVMAARATAPTPPPAVVTAAARAPVAVYIGDSYTQGAGGGGVRWSAIVSKAEGWQEVDLGRGGTGYQREVTGPTAPVACGLDICPAYPAMINPAAGHAPQVVVVAGGRNDGSVYPSTIRLFYADLRLAMPSAHIYAVSPLWDDDPAPAWLADQAAQVRDSARSVGAAYLDIGQPLDGRPDLVAGDGVHPNPAGHQAIAAAVIDALAYGTEVGLV